MSEVLGQADALLGSDAVAHVWTTNADGTPQVSVVWVIAQGDEIVFGTDTASQKAKNLPTATIGSCCRSRTPNETSAASSAIWWHGAAPGSIPGRTLR